ncbi:alkaline phosphatase D family protein [Congregicoccus parvus]|uniref:alkaline phosphatase D family protein n=1 Tax=Congregicoccus parvus TaxID=3081749 RepID=UPI003FA5796E
MKTGSHDSCGWTSRIPRAFRHWVTACVAWAAPSLHAGLEFGPISGAVTTHSAEVRVGVAPNGEPWSIVARQVGRGAGDVVTAAGVAAADESDVLVFRLDGLSAGAEYEYAVVEGSGSTGVAATGRFRTFPDRAASFRFVFGSCARTGSDHEVFSAIRAVDPMFFLHTGDLHYENIPNDDPEAFRAAYRRVFTSPRQAALLRSVPLVYVWDDHDFGPNDSDRGSPGRSAARRVYRETIPHYPLAFGSGDEPISQAFSIGRARFVVTDLRSERSASGDADTAHKTMFGDLQKEWFKREILAAHRSHAVVFWVSPVSWISRAGRGGDNWGAYDTERQELARFFADNGVDNLVVLSGDAHMLAADDGRNARYAGRDRAGPIAVLQAASLDQSASYKGGPYSHGAYLPGAEEGCFGLVDVFDDGLQVRVAFSGRNHLQEEKIRLEFVVPGRSSGSGDTGRAGHVGHAATDDQKK